MIHDAEHYPVRKRGEARRLNPNLEAIEWLEESTREATEIACTVPAGPPGLITLYGRATIRAFEAPFPMSYTRPMFQVIDPEASSTLPVNHAGACPDCFDFSRSWTCELHKAAPTGLDAVRQSWDFVSHWPETWDFESYWPEGVDRGGRVRPFTERVFGNGTPTFE